MTDWMYMQEKPSEQLAQLHYLSFIKQQQDVAIPFHITVKEFAVPPPGQHLRFFCGVGQSGQSENRVVRALRVGDFALFRAR
jgi:hypothetical protein